MTLELFSLAWDFWPVNRAAYLTSTRATRSSSTAALTSTEPILVSESSILFAAEERTENLVPIDVADNAAPMMNVSTAALCISHKSRARR